MTFKNLQAKSLTAKQAYEQQYSETIRRLDMVRDALVKQHQAIYMIDTVKEIKDGSPIDWGHVGSVNYARRQLEPILAHFHCEGFVER